VKAKRSESRVESDSAKLSQSDLETFLAKGDAEACLSFFRGMSEADRRSYAKLARAALENENKGSWQETKVGDARCLQWMESKNLAAACCAALSTLSLAEIKRQSRNFIFAKSELFYAALAARKPDWLTEWAEWRLVDRPTEWWVVRRFMQEGLCLEPEGDHYVLGMIIGLCEYHETESTIYKSLLADPRAA